MSATEIRGLGRVDGVGCRPDGAVVLEGAVLALYSDVDAAFRRLGERLGAVEMAFTPLLSVSDMRRLDYFASFPQLVTLPVTSERDDASLSAFRAANRHDVEGALRLPTAAPLATLLAPAACYAVYPSLEGTRLGAGEARVVGTCGTCFRSETDFEPLRRQWSFHMREVVHVGTAASASAFLDAARERVVDVCRAWDLPVDVVTATDPFFDPKSSARYLHQKLFPTKLELVFEGDLAIGSLNYHRNFFGDAFDLRAGDDLAHTACVAFGLERWVYAILRRHGANASSWPTLR